MTILGIETSCDETAAAIVRDGTQLISNVVASSQAMHAKFGGIIPEQAAREQIKSIIPVITEALKEFRVQSSEFVEKKRSATNHELRRTTVPAIDAIAVTVGPGLIGSLLVGVETAKTLAYVWNKPLIPVNHLVGHIYANWLSNNSVTLERSDRVFQKDAIVPPVAGLQHDTKTKLPEFPALVLLVSGGHSELVLMIDHGKFKYLGGTRDDAAGECFDKCARILNLGYPGGPAVSRAAQEFVVRSSESGVKLPRPMINDKSFDFSFSGLKTAVANAPHDNPNYLAYELQEAITDVLITKTLRAAEKYQVKNILLAGGVAANKRLREKFMLLASKYMIHIPEFALCTDNAAYIASAAFFNQKFVPWQKVHANPSLSI